MSNLALLGGTPVRTKPFTSWPIITEEDKIALEEVLYSGKWGRHLGQKVADFEKEFAGLIHADDCVAVMNGTIALEIALRAMGIGTGDEVIVPDYTFVATASAVLMVGAVPVFTDIDPETYCIDPQSIERNITNKTRVIIPVHFGGGVANLDSIREISNRNNLMIIEDACQSHLAEWKRKKVGTIEDLGCFSFQASKSITSGEGGAVVGKKGELMNRVYSIHTCGRDRNGIWYHHPHVGTNARMTEFQGALLLSQMSQAKKQVGIRESNARYLIEKLNNIEGIKPLRNYPATTRNAYHLFVMRYDARQFDNVSRNRFIEALQAEGIPCQSGYVPLHREGFYKEAFASAAYEKIYGKEYLNEYASRISCPNSEKASDQESIWLGQSLLLGTHDDIDDIVNAIFKIQANIAKLH